MSGHILWRKSATIAKVVRWSRWNACSAKNYNGYPSFQASQKLLNPLLPTGGPLRASVPTWQDVYQQFRFPFPFSLSGNSFMARGIQTAVVSTEDRQTSSLEVDFGVYQAALDNLRRRQYVMPRDACETEQVKADDDVVYDDHVASLNIDYRECEKALKLLDSHQSVQCDPYSLKIKVEKLRFFLVDVVVDDLYTLLPNLRKQSSLYCLQENVRFLIDMGFKLKDIACFVKRHRTLLRVDVTFELLVNAKVLRHYLRQNFHPVFLRMQNPLSGKLPEVVKFLKIELGMSRSDIMSLLLHPTLNVLNEDVEGLQRVVAVMRHLRIPRITKCFKSFIRHSNKSDSWATEKVMALKFYWSESEIGPTLQRLPGILSRPSSELAKVHEVLTDAFGPEEALAMVRKQMSLLTNNSKSLEDRILFLMIKFGSETAIRMMIQNPSILCISMERVERKLNYLTDEMDRCLYDVVKFPTFLTRSLVNCIKPRHRALKEHSAKFCLSYMLGCGKKVFKVRFERFLEPDFMDNVSAVGMPKTTIWQLEEQEKVRRILLENFGTLGTCELLQAVPSLINAIPEDLASKLAYLLHEMNRTPEKVMKFPGILLKSLEKCIIPRHKCLGERAGNYSLSYMYGFGKEQFDKVFKVSCPY